MSENNRSYKARCATLFARILARDTVGRPVTVLVPGSEGKQYEVIIRRNGHISVECNLSTLGGIVCCKGNRQVVCYHAMAALLVAAGVSDKRIAFCDTRECADRLARVGRTVHEVHSHDGGRSIFMCVREDKLTERIEQETSREQRARDKAALYGEG